MIKIEKIGIVVIIIIICIYAILCTHTNYNLTIPICIDSNTINEDPEQILKKLKLKYK